MAGIPGTDYYTDDRVVEFKYYRGKDAERMLSLSEPLPEHVEQVKGYAEDTKGNFLITMCELMWCISALTKGGNVGRYIKIK